MDTTALHDFLETAPDAMLLINAYGNIVHANIQALQLFGYPATELIGRSVDVLVPQNARNGHTAPHETCKREAGIRTHAVTRQARRVWVARDCCPWRSVKRSRPVE